MAISQDIVRSLYKGDLHKDKLCKETLSNTDGIDYIDEPISYEDFFQKYLLPNRACVLGPWAMEGWQSRKDWITAMGQPDWNFMKTNFGDAMAAVADCKREEYSAHPKRDLSVSDFVDYITRYRQSDYNSQMDCLYLKDWHFMQMFPSYKAYSTPVFFHSDWMNEWWDRRTDTDDDYRFVYMGPKGSWTPFHADVFRSYSWSANVCGKKRWILFLPGEEEKLKDSHGNLVFDLNSRELEDRKKYPNAGEPLKRFEVIQGAGEVIFVPSGWHHQVFNLEDTISINHNWMNGASVDLCWAYIKSSLCDVQHEITDCRAMEGWGAQCQLILRASSGINYAEFYQFMLCVAQRRLQCISQCTCANSLRCEQTESGVQQDGEPRTGKSYVQEKAKCRSEPCENCEAASALQGEMEALHLQTTHSSTDGGNEAQGPCCCNHFLFDLMAVQNVVNDMRKTREFLEFDLDQFPVRPRQLIQDIDKVLASFFR